MKKTLLALMLVLAAGSAEASFQTGPYITGRVGMDYSKFTVDDDSNSKATFMSALAFGLRMKVFRLEAEIADSVKKKVEDMKYGQMRYALQGYFDFPTRTFVRPFLNIGCGADYIEANSKKKVSGETSDDKTVFMWNVGAGIGIDLPKSWTIDFGYRYVMPNKAKLFDDYVKIRTHEGYFGVRYTF